MSFQKLIRFSSSTNQQLLNLLPANRGLCSIGSSNRSSLNPSSLNGRSSAGGALPRRTLSSQTSPDQSSDNKLLSADGEWHVSAGLVIQRYPVLTPELNVVEKSFHEYNLKLEYAKSLLSDYDCAIHKVR